MSINKKNYQLFTFLIEMKFKQENAIQELKQTVHLLSFYNFYRNLVVPDIIVEG